MRLFGGIVCLAGLLAAGLVWAEESTPLVMNPKSGDNLYHVAVGVAYTGFQMRYQFTPKWATELRYQFGSADSSQGTVQADVFGLRGYRFYPYRMHWAWYLGSEIAYAQAKADNMMYETTGVAVGAFGGMEYRVMKRLALSMDIGPYAISLKEKHTQRSQSNLDFVVNTALNVFLF